MIFNEKNMARKYKTTGFAKFILFLLFAIPVSWFGASYYYGADPIEEFRQQVGIVSEPHLAEQEISEDLNSKIIGLENENLTLKDEIRSLKEILYDKDQEMNLLKAELEK